VNYLRSQVERLKKGQGTRAQEEEGQNNNEEGERREASTLLDLNVALEMPSEEIPAPTLEEKNK
jgi:hypothetical protein